MDQQSLREAIVLLYKLNNVPEVPRENAIDKYAKNNDTGQQRILGFLQEKQLTETLAFLASTSDDPRKVAAICVEKSLGRQGMTIKMAANHGDLSLVKQGFERMIAILERISRDGACMLIRRLQDGEEKTNQVLARQGQRKAARMHIMIFSNSLSISIEIGFFAG